jgi:hypothetical protein
MLNTETGILQNGNDLDGGRGRIELPTQAYVNIKRLLKDKGK